MSSSPEAPDMTIVSCPHCQQRLRVPQAERTLLVTCTACHGGFEIPAPPVRCPAPNEWRSATSSHGERAFPNINFARRWLPVGKSALFAILFLSMMLLKCVRKPTHSEPPWLKSTPSTGSVTPEEQRMIKQIVKEANEGLDRH